LSREKEDKEEEAIERKEHQKKAKPVKLIGRTAKPEDVNR
jgi:hypothetical protein